MMAAGIHVNWSGIYVKIRASVETETLGALHWDCFATRRK